MQGVGRMKSPAALSPAQRERRLKKWAAENGVELSGLDEWQRGVVLAAVTFLSFVRGVPALVRVVAYLLSHCGMGLSSAVIAQVVGLTDRAVRKARQPRPKEFWRRQQQARRGHAPAKLQPEQVGVVAQFLAENKNCTVAEVLGFIHQNLGVQMDRLTLRRFLARYGLGCLRQQSVEDTPLLSEGRSMGAPSRC
jgi:transposase